MKIIISILVSFVLFGCATQSEKKATIEGVKFKTGKTTEQVIGAIVATLQDENITITNINEKFGIIGTGIQEVPAVTVAKWRKDTAFGLGTASWKVELSFNVRNNGDVKFKYCLHGNDPMSGMATCVPYKSDISMEYFKDKIIENL